MTIFFTLNINGQKFYICKLFCFIYFILFVWLLHLSRTYRYGELGLWVWKLGNINKINKWEWLIGYNNKLIKWIDLIHKWKAATCRSARCASVWSEVVVNQYMNNLFSFSKMPLIKYSTIHPWLINNSNKKNKNPIVP